MNRLGLHLLTGPDRARKLLRIRELERAVGVDPLDMHRVDAAAITAPELLALCRQQPAGGPARLIVVDDAHRLAAETVRALLAQAEVIARTACVVLLVEANLPARHPLAGDPGLQPESFPDRGEPAQKPFALVEALGRRDLPTALGALRDQLSAGREPFEVLGLIGWQIQRWLAVRRLVDERWSLERIGEALRIQTWQLQRIQSELSGRTLADLQALLRRCWRLDGELKTSRTVPGPALEIFIAEICGAGARAELTSRAG